METQIEIKVNKTPKNILDSISKYQKKNRKQMNDKSKRAYYRMKEDPERYALFQERRKQNKLNLKLKNIIP